MRRAVGPGAVMKDDRRVGSGRPNEDPSVYWRRPDLATVASSSAARSRTGHGAQAMASCNSDSRRLASLRASTMSCRSCSNDIFDNPGLRPRRPEPFGRPGPRRLAPFGRPGPRRLTPFGRPGPRRAGPLGRPGPRRFAPRGRPGPRLRPRLLAFLRWIPWAALSCRARCAAMLKPRPHREHVRLVLGIDVFSNVSASIPIGDRGVPTLGCRAQ